MNTNVSSKSSAVNTRRIDTSFGTNSPPLEATGSDKPMGMSSVSGSHNAGHVLDRDQRKDYFPDRFESTEKTESASKLKK